jgi:hypothetical protein
VVALVWLTAASTLLAGLPRFECACPAAQPGPASPDVKAKATGCCCCAPEAGERGDQHPCCQHEGQETCPDSPKRAGAVSGQAPSGLHGPQAATSPTGSPELTQARCAKTPLAPSRAVTAAVSKTHSGGWQAPELLAPTGACPVAAPSSCAAPSRHPWLTSHVPPPTDLVVTLQHFLI